MSQCSGSLQALTSGISLNSTQRPCSALMPAATDMMSAIRPSSPLQGLGKSLARAVQNATVSWT
eukprot:9476-Heterococcus_DN1.PRE.4